MSDIELLFEWDDDKGKANLKKHKVGFAEAKTVFNDPLLITFLDDEHSKEEDRLISIGTSSSSRILLAVHTERKENVIRIISCRKATASERKRYEESEN